MKILDYEGLTYLIEKIKNHNFEVLLTVGAGDVCDYLPEICNTLKQQC